MEENEDPFSQQTRSESRRLSFDSSRHVTTTLCDLFYQLMSALILTVLLKVVWVSSVTYLQLEDMLRALNMYYSYAHG